MHEVDLTLNRFYKDSNLPKISQKIHRETTCEKCLEELLIHCSLSFLFSLNPKMLKVSSQFFRTTVTRVCFMNFLGNFSLAWFTPIYFILRQIRLNFFYYLL